MYRQNSHCSYCGHPFPANQAWPRQCTHCGNTSFLNPLPVAVTIVPVDEGLLAVRRGIDPRKGRLALPGGFIETGESWQEAGAREVWEETGLHLDPHQIQTHSVHSAPDGTLIVFGRAPAQRAADLPPFQPSREATERIVLTEPVELAFPLHTQIAKTFFTQ